MGILPMYFERLTPSLQLLGLDQGRTRNREAWEVRVAVERGVARRLEVGVGRNYSWTDVEAWRNDGTKDEADEAAGRSVVTKDEAGEAEENADEKRCATPAFLTLAAHGVT
jgi:hypothetical protein